MKKSDMLPAIAALVIAILVVPTLAIPVVNAQVATPATGLAAVKTIPEDNLYANTGMMVLGLDPTDSNSLLKPTSNWYVDSTCATKVSSATPGWSATLLGVVVGPELSDEPILLTPVALLTFYQPVSTVPGAACVAHQFAPTWLNLGKGYAPGWKLLSQHKILATLNGQPTKPDYNYCEIVEKEKAKIPPQSSKTASKRQFPDEMIKTTLKDVTDNFRCKFRWAKPGVGVLDVYFVGPHVYNFIADHMLIVTVGYKVGKLTAWANDIQDICILGWAMDNNYLAIGLFLPYTLSEGNYFDIYWSWPNPMGPFVGCDEAAAWQLAWIFGGWGWSSN